MRGRGPRPPLGSPLGPPPLLTRGARGPAHARAGRETPKRGLRLCFGRAGGPTVVRRPAHLAARRPVS